MKQFFKIYPAVFVLTCRENQFRAQNFYRNAKDPVYYDETRAGNEVSNPYIHVGSCAVNKTHTQFTLCVNNTPRTSVPIELPDELLIGLKAETFQGERYVITFVPVAN